MNATIAYDPNIRSNLQENVLSKITSYNKEIIKKSSPSLPNRLNKAFWASMGIWATYNLIDRGLANLLALETLTHGTGPLGFIGINRFGADPNFGGCKEGSSAGSDNEKYQNSSKNYFHVFKDTGCDTFCEKNIPCRAFFFTYINTIAPRLHAVFSGMANFGSSTSKGSTVNKILGGFSGFCTPTLKFRFIPEEVIDCVENCRFENDPDYSQAAYRTSKPIGPEHLGFRGSLTQGINSGMFKRMYSHPQKVALGLIFLGTAALVARTTYRYFKQPLICKEENSEIKTPQKESNLWKNVKVIAKGSGWTALALTAIFLNTL